MDATQFLRWTGAPPAGDDPAWTLTLRFPPTRSQLIGVEPLDPPALVKFCAELQMVRVGFMERIPAGTGVTVKICYAGEPLGEPLVDWSLGAQLLDDVPRFSDRADWKAIYDAREHLAHVSAAHRFFFELDRTTYGPMLLWNTHFDAAECDRRKEIVQLVSRHLKARIEDRRRASDVRGTVPHALECANFIYECSPPAWRVPGWAALARAMEQFAAGDLRTMIDWAQGKQYAVAEPDSYFIFFFAELAICVLEDRSRCADACAARRATDAPPRRGVAMTGRGCWRARTARSHALCEMMLDILPSLVKMQDYFRGRFETWNDITTLGKPEDVLSKAARAAIDEEYRQRKYDARDPAGLAALKARIRQNLGPKP